MGQPKEVRTPEEEAAYREARRAANRERDRKRRSDPAYVAKVAAARQRLREDAEYVRRVRERDAARKRAKQRQPGVGRAEYERRKARASAGACVVLRRCPCGQVLNSFTASQASGWAERREVSVQCGLQEMPPLPLPPETFPSATPGDCSEQRAGLDHTGRPRQALSVLENGTDSGTGKAVECGQQFRCTLCPYKTPRPDKLRCHRLLHSTEKPFKCEVCPAAYEYLMNYKSHMCIHTGEVPFRCSLCPFSTVNQGSFKRHRRTHSHAKHLACTMCRFISKCKADLHTHMANHRNDKPFKCKVCSFGYHRKWALKIHMQQHLVS